MDKVLVANHPNDEKSKRYSGFTSAEWNMGQFLKMIENGMIFGSDILFKVLNAE